MMTINIDIKPLTAFATIIKGDTLFGQLCWAIVHVLGEDKLRSLLKNYHQQPFLVVSDPFPKGYLPKPHLPTSLMGHREIDASERKALKKKIWLSIDDFQQPIKNWSGLAKTETEILSAISSDVNVRNSLQLEQDQPHNSINRQSFTTGGGEFSPYQLKQTWYHPNIELTLYLLVDETQLSLEDLEKIISYCGLSGYGKEASTGLGKFDLVEIKQQQWLKQENSNAWLCLAPVVPLGTQWQAEQCFYQPFTRFGRHGDQLAISGQAFKNPILMAQTGAVLTPQDYQFANYTGSAVGGVTAQFGQLSKVMPETVHQGYTPVLNISL